jgi:hypothetical protein
MKFSVQVIVHPDDDTEASPVVREVFIFDRDDLAPSACSSRRQRICWRRCRIPWPDIREPARTFQPLAELLPERTTPELAYLQARFAALVSYGITANMLGELPPLGRRLHPTVVRRAVHAVADRLEG